ncbi:hypothetical protein TWF718_004980 [Orbilia javanica]|uniref:Uncharacterized protein n=1 Tax=Orbilia javanica TaxID=47235 RepID=A0AAN8RLD5_9PEZI
MEKPNAIELQIAHGRTPVPFMVPMKKATSRQALEEVIRRRSGCGSGPVITMYARNMVIIDWEDWEDLVEPGKRYLADLDNSWIIHSRGRGHGTSNESVNMFLGAIEKGQSPDSLPKPVTQIIPPAAAQSAAQSAGSRIDNLKKESTALEEEETTDAVYPRENQKNFPKPANPRLRFNGGLPPTRPARGPSNLNPNPATFPVSIRPVGMGHGIVNPAMEREVIEALQQQIGTLAVEKPATTHQSPGIQPNPDCDTISTPTEPDESQDEIRGGVKLMPSDYSPESVEAGSSEEKPESISAVEEVKEEIVKDPVGLKEQKKVISRSISPLTSSSTSSKFTTAKCAPAKRVSGEPTPVQTSTIGSTVAPRTFTKPTPFRPVPAGLTSTGPAPVQRTARQQGKSNNNGEYSHLEDISQKGPFSSPPKVVQRSGTDYKHVAGSSGDDEYEEGDEACETIDVPGPSSISSGFPVSEPTKGKQRAQQNDRRQELLKDENRITFYLVKPQNKDKPIVLDKKGRIFLSTSRECCPFRFVKMLGKNPAYTRLLILTPAPDMSRYITMDIINPGSRFAQTPFSVVGLEGDVTMTWEHIENDEEDELIHDECPWDQPDVVYGEDIETDDYDGDDGDDN